jgi:glycosyltransferase involved in cell wall biosynthesis
LNYKKPAYVLITAAKNEESYIEKTIRSIGRQTILPIKWIIINDGSTDNTENIINKYLHEFNYIESEILDSSANRNFASKVYAINRAEDKIIAFPYDYIGILDADITLQESYYEKVLEMFENNSKLGIAGGVLKEYDGVRFVNRIYSPWSVSGGIQLFRRKCYEEIGGLIPLKWGGEDAIAEAAARMHKWEVKSFPDIIGYHHRATGTGNDAGLLSTCFQRGLQDYFYGVHPIYQIGRCIRRIFVRPFLLGSFLQMSGFIWPYLKNETIDIPREIFDHIRKEQLKRMFKIFHA